MIQIGQINRALFKDDGFFIRVETMSQRLSRTFMDYYKGFALNHSAQELEKIKNLKLKDLNRYIKEHKEILDLSFAIVTK